MAEADSSVPTRARLRVRRSPRWLAAGILAVALGGLGSAFGFVTIADTQPVLKVNRTIYRGELIGAQDISVVTIGRGSDVAAIPGDRLNQIVGKNAVTDLPQGSLLVEGAVGQVDLAPGMARVGLKLAPGRLPSTGMPAGTKVLVVAVSPPNAQASEETLPASVPATLTAAPVTAPDGSLIVDVNLAANVAEVVARLAAADQVALVRQAER